MRLTEKHYRCIQMILEENRTITATCEELGIGRTTFYSWMKDEDFLTELHETEQKIKTQANITILSRLPEALERLWNLGGCSDPRTARAATSEWIERAVGKVGTNIILQSNENGETDYNIEDALLRLSDFQPDKTDDEKPRKLG